MRPLRRPRISFALVLTFFLGLDAAEAAWQFNGTPVSTAAIAQQTPAAVGDGAGGVIVAWQDFRNGATYDIYVQRLDAFGVPLWTANGVALCTAANNQTSAMIVSDGSGGAIVAWADRRTGTEYDFYAARVDASGTALWTANGVAVCAAALDQFGLVITTDGAGGAIFAWQDNRLGFSNSDIYVQRLNAAGTPLWTANGVALCTAASNQLYPAIVSNNTGGAIVAWHDARDGVQTDIYARGVSASGAPEFGVDGTAVCTAANNQMNVAIASDGANGAIVAWEDLRTLVDFDIYAQRMAPNPMWNNDGVLVCGATSSQSAPKLTSDGAGGVIAVWQDLRSGLGYDIYARRVDNVGTPLWTADGVALCSAPNSQQAQKVLADGVGGVIVAWEDFRGGSTDIYAQRADASGAPLWTADGIALCAAPNQQTAAAIASDGASGAIVAWQDFRDLASFDIYAQRVERHGHWGFPSPTIAGLRDIPGDQGGVVNLSWDASRLDPYPEEQITQYSIWRAIAPEAAAPFATEGAFRDGVDGAIGADVDLRVQTFLGQTYYWMLVSTVDAIGFTGYSGVVPTLFDSTATSAEYHYFQVLAHTASAYWASAPDSGRSVDNLAPEAPLLLSAQRVGADVNLLWRKSREEDFARYAVYRAATPGVQPALVNFLSSSTDTILTDSNAPVTSLYYVVTAYDAHDNQSAPSNETGVGGASGVGGDAPPAALSVLPNFPNPFSETTELRIGLPRAGEVSIEVYDVAGKRVSGQRRHLESGWQRFVLDGRDGAGKLLPSGVYFYRVRWNGETQFTQTRKLVLVK